MQEAIDFGNTLVFASEDLKKGMYVSYLDRPWMDTPFPFRGFEIETDKELDLLRKNCEYVFIQTERGNFPDGYQRHMEETGRRRKDGKHSIPGLAQWQVTIETEQEYRVASSTVGELRKSLIRVFEAASREEKLDIDAIRAAVRPLRASIERCPDAALYAIRLSDAGDYLYRHAVACAVMGLVMGRALGLPEGALGNLAVACALLDIGKVRVPQELLNRPSTVALTSGEMVQLRKHVRHSVDLIASSPEAKRHLKPIIAYHHERYNGSGYPERLQGDEIPLGARIAGIVDFYDAMISHRAYGRRAMPNEAIRYIRQRRGKDFCPSLVEQFVQIFGLYPTGSLVELSDGRVGRVIQQHPKGLLTPRVQLLLDENKQRMDGYESVDLSTNIGIVDSLCVTRCLKVGSYDIEC